MALRRWCREVAAVLLTASLAVGCSYAPDLTAPEVFVGGFAGVTYQPFKNTQGSNVAVDSRETREGRNTLRVTVPDAGNPANQFAGGTFNSGMPRDLSGYDALTFWARSTKPATITAGLANDNSGSSLYSAEWGAVSLTTGWKKYVIPIPLPSKITSERGLFYMAMGAVGSPAMGYTVWLSDIQYEKLGSDVVGPMRPYVAAASVSAEIGGNFTAFPLGPTDQRGQLTRVIIPVDGTDQVIALSRRYFDFASLDLSVATVAVDGVVTAVGAGTTTVTARIGGQSGAGDLTVNVTAPVLVGPAPTPALPAARVLSLFSDVYPSVPVDNWLVFGNGVGNSFPGPVAVADVSLAGNATKLYTKLGFAGISTYQTQPIDASQMTHFHIDVWSPNATKFEVHLIDFPSGQPDGPGQSEGKVVFDANSTPRLVDGQWVSLDIPMTSFVAGGLQQQSHIGYVVLVAEPATTTTVYVDNLYFHK